MPMRTGAVILIILTWPFSFSTITTCFRNRDEYLITRKSELNVKPDRFFFLLGVYNKSFVKIVKQYRENALKKQHRLMSIQNNLLEIILVESLN